MANYFKSRTKKRAQCTKRTVPSVHIAVTTFMLMKDGVYHIFYFLILVFLLTIFKMIVKRTASHLFEL